MLFLAHHTVFQHSETHFKMLNYWDIFAASLTDAVATIIRKILYYWAFLIFCRGCKPCKVHSSDQRKAYKRELFRVRKNRGEYENREFSMSWCYAVHIYNIEQFYKD